MRTKSDERLQAEKLCRELGLSYNEIAEHTVLSRNAFCRIPYTDT
jgi:hypothetical protein